MEINQKVLDLYSQCNDTYSLLKQLETELAKEVARQAGFEIGTEVKFYWEDSDAFDPTKQILSGKILHIGAEKVLYGSFHGPSPMSVIVHVEPINHPKWYTKRLYLDQLIKFTQHEEEENHG